MTIDQYIKERAEERYSDYQLWINDDSIKWMTKITEELMEGLLEWMKKNNIHQKSKK